MRTETTILRFPIVCPRCASESLNEFPIAVITAALAKGDALPLRAVCHQVSWDASETEREQIREYLLSVSMDEDLPPPEATDALR
jgi:hypothetical protein